MPAQALNGLGSILFLARYGCDVRDENVCQDLVPPDKNVFRVQISCKVWICKKKP